MCLRMLQNNRCDWTAEETGAVFIQEMTDVILRYNLWFTVNLDNNRSNYKAIGSKLSVPRKSVSVYIYNAAYYMQFLIDVIKVQ